MSKETKESFIIEGLGGQKKLSGELKVNGSKNAILPVFASSLIFNKPIECINVPDIEDVSRMTELLLDLGVSVEKISKRKYLIHGNKISKHKMNEKSSKRLRASVILTGPILTRMGKVSFPHPGGCVIGTRPIDLFLSGFKKMGAKVFESKGNFNIVAPRGGLRGADIFFNFQSVTATETFVLAALLAKGKTKLKNVALEPEVISMIKFLISCGAKIKGVGTPNLEITGGSLLTPKEIYKTIPDRLEAGSFLILGSLCAKNLTISNCNPEHLDAPIRLLKQAGVNIETGKSYIKIKNNQKIKPKLDGVTVKTHEYPGFPTDLQAPFTVFLTQTEGENRVFETIFEGRLNYTEDLVSMGADITMWDAHRVTIKGPKKLRGREVDGPDIRAGLAFIIAGAIANGESVINNIYYVDRGYEKIEERLQSVGLNIKRI